MTLFNYIYILFFIARCYDNYTYAYYFYRCARYLLKKRDIKKTNIEDDYIVINIQSNNISKYDTTTATAGENETVNN
ncbi:uncharacterized protein METZ01_LOCUS39245 [marine metagenome]|uniref:Uncharacterized protein n=1 Tax=marine metagenome TaxID=408172 RepID=A0A381R3R0_9ZZZZ